MVFLSRHHDFVSFFLVQVKIGNFPQLCLLKTCNLEERKKEGKKGKINMSSHQALWQDTYNL